MGETKEKCSSEHPHESTKAYSGYMRPRCVELPRAQETGSFYYKGYWQASHHTVMLVPIRINANTTE